MYRQVGVGDPQMMAYWFQKISDTVVYLALQAGIHR
jgi:hypothetical protein